MIDIGMTRLLLPGIGSAALAGIIGTSIASIYNYTANRLWTFKSTDPKVLQEGSRFVTVLVSSWILHAVLYSSFVTLSHSWLESKIATSGLLIFWNYYWHKRWTFGKVR